MDYTYYYDSMFPKISTGGSLVSLAIGVLAIVAM